MIQTRSAVSRALSSAASSDSTASSGPVLGQQPGQHLLRGPVAGVLQLAADQSLPAHLEQALAGGVGQPGRQCVVVEVLRVRR